jgi:hypothetical protein
MLKTDRNNIQEHESGKGWRWRTGCLQKQPLVPGGGGGQH